MSIQFSKMHGLGNDFVVIDNIHQTVKLDQQHIQWLCDRHMGIGCDQLLLIEPAKNADFACRIFNANGSEAEQCGNGIRCVARFIHENRLTPKKTFSIKTKGAAVDIVIHDFDNIQATMGVPIFEPQKIPFKALKEQLTYDIEGISFSVLSMGNPHAITKVPSIDNAAVNEIGAKITNHELFPQGTNVGFVEIIDRKHIRLRTFERGVGETFACGSNACAAVVAGIKNHWLDHEVIVHLTHGDLTIRWLDEKSPVIMIGPAAQVFVGSLKDNIIDLLAMPEAGNIDFNPKKIFKPEDFK